MRRHVRLPLGTMRPGRHCSALAVQLRLRRSVHSLPHRPFPSLSRCFGGQCQLLQPRGSLSTRADVSLRLIQG
jgi:hypothetical protein